MADARAPRVSAIIIVLNGEKYLAEAIESVMAQTMPDWELIVVDDGSTDRSRAIARDYAARLPHKIFSIAHSDRSNHGMSATRNLGIGAARGAFIGFLDCDDVWEPEKLEEQLAIMAEYPSAGMIYGRTLIWHSWKGAPAPPTTTTAWACRPGCSISRPGSSRRWSPMPARPRRPATP